MRPRAALATFLLALAALGCPPPPFHGDPSSRTSYNHSQNSTLSTWFQGTDGASGLWSTTVGNFRYVLAGTNRGLRIQSLDASGIHVDVDGPTVATGALQRDVETYGSYAYLCSNATGPVQGVLIVDLSALPAKATVAGAFTPQDGDPKAINLSIDAARGLLFLQRSQGVEVWDLKPDPLHPAYVAKLAADAPVSDLEAQDEKLYVAEGSAKRFSIWDVHDPAHAAMLARWSVPGFANSIWPREDGQVLGTLDETAAAPVKFWAANAQSQVVPAGTWNLDGQTLATSIKVRGDWAYIAHRQAGLVVLRLTDLSKPTFWARFDGPFETPEPALRETREVLLIGDPRFQPSSIILADGAKGLVQVTVY